MGIDVFDENEKMMSFGIFDQIPDHERPSVFTVYDWKDDGRPVYGDVAASRIIERYKSGDCKDLAVNAPTRSCRTDVLTCAAAAWRIIGRDMFALVSTDGPFASALVERGAVLLRDDYGKTGFDPMFPSGEETGTDLSSFACDRSFAPVLIGAAVIHGIPEFSNRIFPKPSSAAAILDLLPVLSGCPLGFVEKSTADIERVYSFLHLEDFGVLDGWVRDKCDAAAVEEYSLALSSLAVWRHLLAKSHLRFEMGDDDDPDEIRRCVASLRDYLGMDFAIRALREGVPLEYVLA